MTTTVILVHGAFADSSSWNDVAAILDSTGHRVLAYANPLRGVAQDAAGMTDLVRSVDGPVVLAGHSYGGAVITNVPPPTPVTSSVGLRRDIQPPRLRRERRGRLRIGPRIQSRRFPSARGPVPRGH